MKNAKKENVKHTFPPVYDSNSEILILGSFPSVKSREQGFTMDIRRTGFGRSLLQY